MSTIEHPPQTPGPSDLRWTLEVDQAQGVLRPHGEIDIATAPLVEREAQALWAGGTGPVVLDLRAVSFFDSSGLRLLMRLQALADEQPHRSFALADCSDIVRRVLDLTHLADRFETHASA